MNVAVIPARFSSSRFPGKLLKKAAGKTVLQRTFEKAQNCPDLDQIFIATDHEDIRDHAEEIGAKVIWTSKECPNGTFRIIEAMGKEPLLNEAEVIVNLQGDHPLTESRTISEIIRILKEDSKAMVSTAATQIKDIKNFLSPHIVKCVFDQNFNALYFSRSPIPYSSNLKLPNAFAHIGIYCYRPSYLQNFSSNKPSYLQKVEDLEQLQVLEKGERIKIAIVEEEILGIDTPEDLEKLKGLLCRSQNISL